MKSFGVYTLENVKLERDKDELRGSGLGLMKTRVSGETLGIGWAHSQEVTSVNLVNSVGLRVGDVENNEVLRLEE